MILEEDFGDVAGVSNEGPSPTAPGAAATASVLTSSIRSTSAAIRISSNDFKQSTHQVATTSATSVVLTPSLSGDAVVVTQIESPITLPQRNVAQLTRFEREYRDILADFCNTPNERILPTSKVPNYEPCLKELPPAIIFPKSTVPLKFSSTIMRLCG